MLTDEEWWEIFRLLPYESKPIREALDELIANRVRAAKEQAWNEGYMGCCEIDREENQAHDYCPNPYRQGTETQTTG